MKKELWLIWEAPTSHRRYKIGALVKEKNRYTFHYVQPNLDDAKAVGFKYFPGFKNLTKSYKSAHLFTNILTRLPNKTRPDYLEILNDYHLKQGADDFDILKATRGETFTDSYEFVSPFDS